jgi:hypothetical protein
MKKAWVVLLVVTASCAADSAENDSGATPTDVEATTEALLPAPGTVWQVHADGPGLHLESRGDFTLEVGCILWGSPPTAIGAVALANASPDGYIEYDVTETLVASTTFQRQSLEQTWRDQVLFQSFDKSQGNAHLIAAPSGFNSCDSVDAVVTITAITQVPQ